MTGRRELVFRDVGGWISGPCIGGPGGSLPNLPALLRLIDATETWAIEYHPDLECWSAERAEGTAVRYLAAHSTAELAAKIAAAEAG